MKEFEILMQEMMSCQLRLEGGDGTGGSNSRQAKMFLFLAAALNTGVILFSFLMGAGGPQLLFTYLVFSLDLGHFSFEEGRFC